MGQTISSPGRADASQGRSSRVSRLRGLGRPRAGTRPQNSQEEGSQSLLEPRHTVSLGADISSRREGSRFGAPATVFRRQVSARSAPTLAPVEVEEPRASEQDAVVYEHEERPLMSVEDIRIGDAPISNITALPMPRSPSVMARISSRLSQRYSSVEPSALDLEDESSAWPRPSGDSPLEWQAESFPESHRRRSMFGSIADTLGRPTTRARRRLTSVSRPVSMDVMSHYEQLNPLGRPSLEPAGPTHLDVLAGPSRLSRVRRSISGPLEALMGRSHSMRPSEPYEEEAVQSRLSRTQSAEASGPDETEYLLPPINFTGAIDLDEHSANPGAETGRRADTPIPETPSRSSWGDRWMPRAPTIRREPRRVPNMLRNRSSRVIRRDDELPLSRILQLAAAAIAAQLSGNSDAMSNLESMGDDQFDGGLNTFMDDLNTAAGSSPPGAEGSSTDGNAPAPLNFWRAFRFMGSPNQQRSLPATGEEPEQRTVTLVVVGVRSVPSSSLVREAQDGVEANLDSLLGDVPPVLTSQSRNRRPRSFLRNVNGRSPFAALSRRSSTSGPDVFPAPYESQRHSRGESSRGGVGLRDLEPMLSTDTEVEPVLGPRPPPTTPAELAQSLRDTSYASSRRASVASESDLSSANRGSVGERPSRANGDGRQERAATPQGPVVHSYGEQPIDLSTIPNPPPVRRRRRSDSELARSETLASHRNGTIDPDGGPLMGRSWLIYVVGTNLPADHPIFQVPSLLSENPTYEDMLTLSNLLGPVRPPVATPNDVERAGGLFTLVAGSEANAEGSRNSILRAVPADGSSGSPFDLVATDNCLICLGGYAAAEELRELSKCKHRYHRACIDEWLTTGRNSCPLCRAAGVPRDEPPADSTSSPMPTAA